MFTFNENINSFVVDFKSHLSAFDINQFKENCMVLNEASGFLPLGLTGIISPQLYCSYIDKTLENLESVTGNVDVMDDFFSKVYKSAFLADKDITITLHSDEQIEKIRPEYLNQIAIDFNVNMKKILEGELKNTDIKKKYVSGDYFEKIKRQLVKTNIVVNDVRDLLVAEAPTVVKIDNDYLQNNAIPFIRSYNQNVKDLSVISTNLKGRINDTYTDIQNTIAAVNKLQSEGKLDKETISTVNYYKYNVMRNYMNLCAYISGMLIRKISFYTYNMMSYTNLYNTIYNFFPEGELILHESVIDGDLSDIDDSTLLQSIVDNDLNIIIPHVQNAIGKKKMEISNLMAKRYNYRLMYDQKVNSEKYPYDITPYRHLNNTINAIHDSINKFEENMKNSDLVVDDIIESSGLEETFSTKYGDILSKVPSIEYYTLQESEGIAVALALFNDLDHFVENVTMISDNVYKVYSRLEELVKEFDLNDDPYDDATYNELKSFVISLMKNYKDYILLLTKALLERLDNLTDSLDDAYILDAEENADTENAEFEFATNYDADIAFEAFDEIVEEERIALERCFREYNKIRAKKDRGVDIVYEEVKPAENNGEKTSGPVVKTDAQAHYKEKESGTQSNAPNVNGEQKENVVDKFKAWFKKIIDQFKSKSKKLTTKNNAWLASVKNSINSLPQEVIDETTITLAEYKNVTSERISTDITSAMNKINSISPTSLPNELTGNRSKAELYLFNSIPERIGKITGFNARIKQFFIYGNKDKEALMTYSGSDAKTKIDEIISYCEGYQSMYTKISADLDKLVQAAADKQEKIIASLKSGKNVNESVLFEKDQNGDVKEGNTKVAGSEGSEDKLKASSVITTIVRDYSGAILTVMEKKYLDYIRVLDKIAPKTENTKPETSTSEEE